MLFLLSLFHDTADTTATSGNQIVWVAKNRRLHARKEIYRSMKAVYKLKISLADTNISWHMWKMVKHFDYKKN